MEQRRYQTGKHLEAFILLLIQQNKDHGGGVLSRLKEWLPDAWVIDSGRLYRYLRDLEDTGCLTSQWLLTDRVPTIRVYEITDKGVARLQEWAEEIALRQKTLGNFLGLWSDLNKRNVEHARSDDE